MLNEFSDYCKTLDYAHGAMVAITGVVIELLLILIAIPIVLHFINRIRSRRIRATVDFYLFQVFHKGMGIFLRMLSINNLLRLLLQEMSSNPNFVIFKHNLYGNLDNVLFVLKKRLPERDIVFAELMRKSAMDFKGYLIAAKEALDEIDKLIMMVSYMPSVQKELFKIRAVFYATRDAINEVCLSFAKMDEPFIREFRYNDLIGCIKMSVDCIEKIFSKRRRLIDSQYKINEYLFFLKLFISLPFVLLWRCGGRIFCSFKGDRHASGNPFNGLP